MKNKKQKSQNYSQKPKTFNFFAVLLAFRFCIFGFL